MRRLFTAFTFLFFGLIAIGQQREAPFDMNQQLGRGINMGNAFEAPSEDAWGNPWKPEYFEIIADLGFNHVRLPVRWEPSDRSMEEESYTISKSFMERIQTVVDKALEEDLKIIINMHHHEALFADPSGQKDRFLSQWRQIAEYFQNYSDDLLFEVLNEPHGELSPELWNTYFADALKEIRATNPDRFVLMGTASYGGVNGVSDLELPDDENLILTVHYYNPFQFTHQGADWVGDDADQWLGTEWYDTEAERATIAAEFEPVLKFSENHHIPVHVGEFGAYSKADMESRVRWTNFCARWFEEQGFSWAYWEFSAGFGIYDPENENYHSGLVDALLENPMPEPTPVETIAVYESDFSSGTDGWTLNTNEEGSATLSAIDNRLVVDVQNGGSEGWHVQLAQEGFSLEQDAMYRLSFTASSGESGNRTVYMGMSSDPWGAYSDYFAPFFESDKKQFVYSFTMNEESDSEARLVLDLGGITGNVEIDEIKLANVVIGSTGDQNYQRLVSVYPNPVEDFLHYASQKPVQRICIRDLTGRKRKDVRNGARNGKIYVSGISAGLYFMEVILRDQSREVHKIVVL